MESTALSDAHSGSTAKYVVCLLAHTGSYTGLGIADKDNIELQVN